MSNEQIIPFSIEERRLNGTLVLTLYGELDLVSAAEVGARLDALRSAGEPVLLDLDELDFMDSSGLRMVLNAAEARDAEGWQFSLTHGPGQVQRLFESTCVTHRLPIVPRPN
jgi:anti-anti-sigma factor